MADTGLKVATHLEEVLPQVPPNLALAKLETIGQLPPQMLIQRSGAWCGGCKTIS